MKVIEVHVGAMLLLEDYRLLSLLWWQVLTWVVCFVFTFTTKKIACNQFLQLKNVVCNSFLIANDTFYLQITMFSYKN